jgi:hypothetical protein
MAGVRWALRPTTLIFNFSCQWVASFFASYSAIRNVFRFRFSTYDFISPRFSGGPPGKVSNLLVLVLPKFPAGLSGGESGQGVALTTYPLLAPRLKKEYQYPL